VVRALVSAAAVAEVVAAHANQANDAARRLGCTAQESPEAVRLAALQLIDDVDRRPETVRDLVGAFLARVRTQAETLRRTRAGLAPNQTPASDAPAAVVRSAAQSAAVVQALDSLSDEDRLALLAKDSYDLTVHQAAVALSLDAPESARTIALARLQFVAAVEGDAPLSLAGHDVAVGDLGQLADGSAPPGGRFAALRRHVSGCARCASALGVQTRSTAMLAALPILALDDLNRDAIIEGTRRQAAAVLPTDAEIRRELEEGSTARPIIAPLIVIGALLGALVLGGGVGALFASDPANGSPEVTPPTTGPSSTSSSTPTTPVRSATAPEPTVITSTAVVPISPPTSSTKPPPTISRPPTTAVTTPPATPTSPTPTPT
jgi:DNA-directed RNA polymerase specialized sigma24 family protein